MVNAFAMQAVAAHSVGSVTASTCTTYFELCLSRLTIAIVHPDTEWQDAEAGLRVWLYGFAKNLPPCGCHQQQHDPPAAE